MCGLRSFRSTSAVTRNETRCAVACGQRCLALTTQRLMMPLMQAQAAGWRIYARFQNISHPGTHAVLSPGQHPVASLLPFLVTQSVSHTSHHTHTHTTTQLHHCRRGCRSLPVLRVCGSTSQTANRGAPAALAQRVIRERRREMQDVVWGQQQASTVYMRHSGQQQPACFSHHLVLVRPPSIPHPLTTLTLCHALCRPTYTVARAAPA